MKQHDGLDSLRGLNQRNTENLVKDQRPLPRGDLAPSTRYLHSQDGRGDQMAVALLPMLADWSWIHRRVESIKVINHGQTRRSLSFDFTLPRAAGLRWHDVAQEHRTKSESQTGQVIVPLTFLRKGMLINLDLTDGNGASIPSLGFSDNTDLTFHPMRLLVDELGLARAAQETFGDLPLADDGEDPVNYDTLLRRALIDVIQSSGYDRARVDPTHVERRQELERHNLFSGLAELACLLRRGQTGSELETWAQTWCQQFGAGTRYDSSVPLHVLICMLVQEMVTVPGVSQPAHDRTLALLELLCILLSVTSFSYLFATVLDEDVVWPAAGCHERTTPRRMVKLQCDVEISDSSLTLSDRLRPGTPILVRCAQWSAASTHLELVLPPQSYVAEIVGMSERRAAVDPSTQDHGSFRSSQTAVHVSKSRPPVRPLDALRITIAPQIPTNVVVASLLALLVAAGSWSAALRHADAWVSTFDTYLTLMTLVIAVFGAMYFTTGTHRLSQRVTRSPRVIILVAAAITSLSTLQFLPGALGRSMPAEVRTLIGCVTVALGVLLFAYSAEVFSRARQSVANLHTDRLIPTAAQPTDDERRIVSVTETGAFDCDYLTPDFFRADGSTADGSAGIRSHLDGFGTLTRSLVDPGRPPTSR